MARSDRSDRDACQPTTKRLNTSMMNATNTHPVCVLTVRSATQSRFGAGARNCRSTRSSGRTASPSAIVVVGLNRFPLVTPVRPMVRMSRSAVQPGNADAVVVELCPDLVGAVGHEVGVIDPPDLGLQLLVTHHPGTSWPLLAA